MQAHSSFFLAPAIRSAQISAEAKHVRSRSTSWSVSLFGAAFALTALGANAAHAEGVSAGTLIENTATATYDDGGGEKTIDSNTVTLRVDELLDVTITSLDSGPLAAVPGEAVLTFEITNQGNGPEAYQLTANPVVAGNDFDTTVDSIAVDTNGNGTYDPGVDEILTAPETTAVLAADETLTVFVIVTVPDGVTDGQESDIELTADAVTGTGAPGTLFAGQGVDGGDAIVGTTGASATATGELLVGITSVDLTKAASIVDPFGGTSAVPGAVVTFTITADVAGSGSVDDLIVTDTIPDGTTYAAGTLALDGNPLTDVSGDDAGEASDASGISVDLGTVAAGSSQAITFNVTID
ncbi:hypothetical protein [uncultured Erythrobacter sp.]|uniref:hypothetical protein n=1 Tax=uncultured Erythrobacter sp. TaxID=263913 RepID=UPI002603AADD|nr:hypothetical protein [uncultured Erythrobacter sp.]